MNKYFFFLAISFVLLLAGCSSPDVLVARGEAATVPWEIEETLPAEPQDAPVLSIFGDDEFLPYNTWEEIDTVLQRFTMSRHFTDRQQREIPLDDREESYRESLTYFTYALNTYFADTQIGEHLEEINICPGCRYVNWGNVIFMPPVGETQGRDGYVIASVHELAHTIDLTSDVSAFRELCWGRYQGDWYDDHPIMKEECADLREAFVPFALTTDRVAEVPYEGDELYYYSATDFREDLAETVTAYAISGPQFRALAGKYPVLKEKYEWVKENVFKGKEFR